MISYIKVITYFVISFFKSMQPRFLIKLLAFYKNLVQFFNVIAFIWDFLLESQFWEGWDYVFITVLFPVPNSVPFSKQG